MSERFYVAELSDREGDEITIAGVDGRHLARVLRAQPGQFVQLFDGSGSQWSACVLSVGKDQVTVELRDEEVMSVERARPIDVAVSLPTGDRQRFVIEKLVELGVRTIIPLQTQHSNDRYSKKSIERWNRWIIDASKQCRRNRLMNIGDSVSLSLLLENESLAVYDRWLAHPYGLSQDQMLKPSESRPVLITVGPEAGFTDDEAQRAIDAGWMRLELGKRILRVETAAIAAVCCFGQD